MQITGSLVAQVSSLGAYMAGGIVADYKVIKRTWGGNRVKRNLGDRTWRRLVSYTPPAVGLVVGVVQASNWWRSPNGRAPWISLALASVVLGIAIFALEAVVNKNKSASTSERKRYGWLSIWIGADGFVSTSKVQAILWTLGLVFGLTFLTGLVVLGAKNADGVGVTADAVFQSGDQWDNYLVLLGGPFASAVLAKQIMTAKTEEGRIQTTTNPAATEDTQSAIGTAPTHPSSPEASPSVGDIVTNNVGELDLVDTQYLLFNLVAFVYVAAVFISNAVKGAFGLPDVPGTLLGLTTLSAATYVSNKAVLRSAPGITSVYYEKREPPSAPAAVAGQTPEGWEEPGQLVILGVNLCPSGTTMKDNELRGATQIVITATGESKGITLVPIKVTITEVRAKLDKPLLKISTVRVITASNTATNDYQYDPPSAPDDNE